MIRSANVKDAKRLSEIYSYYVENTAISFEYDAPTPDEFAKRMEHIMEKYPYLVLEDDGTIVGYAYAGPLKDRVAYDRCVEVTIYLDAEAKGNGYGRKLYEALEEELKKIGILNLYACIADPIEEDEYLNRNSEEFHQHMGYVKIAEFHKCGYLFDRWYNMIWMEKMIGEHE